MYSMFVDSHCHIDCLKLDPYNGDLDACLDAAREVGVSQFLCVCIDLENSDAVINLAHQHPDILATVGVHPLYKDSMEPTVELLLDKIKRANQDARRVVAVGETGLDYHYCPEKPAWQRERFITHLQAAEALQLPVVIHSRAAKSATLDLLKAFETRVTGVMHCFTEDLDMAKQCIDLGYLISISGVVTFNNATELREVVRSLPLDCLMIETDSPYLAPKPYRGRSNEPRYVIEVAKKIAELKGVSVEQVGEVTRENFRRFIGA